MQVVGKEGCAKTADQDKGNHANRDQHAHASCVCTGQVGHNSRTASDKHGRDEDVGDQSVDHEYDVRDCSPSCSQNLEEGDSVWCIQL